MHPFGQKILDIAHRLGIDIQSTYPHVNTVESCLLSELEAAIHDFAHVSGFGYDGWCKVMNPPQTTVPAGKPNPNIIGEIINYLPLRSRDWNEMEAVVITCLMNQKYDLGLDHNTIVNGVQCHGTAHDVAVGLIKLEFEMPSARLMHQMHVLCHYIDVFEKNQPPECGVSAGHVLRIVTKAGQHNFKEHNEDPNADS